MTKLFTNVQTAFANRRREKKEAEYNVMKCSFLMDGTTSVREYAVDRSLTPEQVIQFLRCRWTLVPEAAPDQLGLYVSGSNTHTDRWLQNQPIGKSLDTSERFLMIRNKNKLMKLGLPDKSLRTLSLNMTTPVTTVVDSIAAKLQLPELVWSEYSLCVNFDKESKQLELALKFIQNAKSLSSLKKMMTSSGSENFISKKTRTPMWLNPEQTLAEMEPLITNRLLCFRRRFWFSEMDLVQADSKLLYFQYQEVKAHLQIMGSLIKSCSIGLADAAKLVVLLSRIDSQDKNSEEALRESARSLFPHNTDSLLQLINAKLRAGEYRLPTDERELQIKFITMTRSLSPFGETYFPARDQNNNEVLLAVSRLCIGWYIDGILEEKFSIDRIRRWMAIPEKQLFQMEIDRGYSELHVLEWATSESTEIQELLDGYVQLTLRHKKRNSTIPKCSKSKVSNSKSKSGAQLNRQKCLGRRGSTGSGSSRSSGSSRTSSFDDSGWSGEEHLI